MSNPRQCIIEAAARRGLSMSGASRMIGRSSSFLSRFVHEDVPRQLSAADRRHLALCLDLDEASLIAPEHGFVRGA